MWDECWATAEGKARTITHEDLFVLVLELVLEKESIQHLNAWRLGGGNSGNHGRGYQEPQPGQRSTLTNAPYMSNVQDLFSCNGRDEKDALVHALTATTTSASWSRAKSRRPTTAERPRFSDHYRCTIILAFCCKCKHYEDRC